MVFIRMIIKLLALLLHQEIHRVLARWTYFVAGNTVIFCTGYCDRPLFLFRFLYDCGMNTPCFSDMFSDTDVRLIVCT
jgi:hypothetical protein